jgi:hypothetical protein
MTSIKNVFLKGTDLADALFVAAEVEGFGNNGFSGC